MRDRRWVAVVRAIAIVTPLGVAASAGHTTAGLTVSFGSYLMFGAFSPLAGRSRGTLLAAGATALIVAGVAGAFAAPRLPLLLAGAIVLAALQGLFEMAGGPLRMTAAMSVLAFLLAGVNLAQGVAWSQYAILLAAGVLWQGMIITVTGTRTGPSLRQCLRTVRRQSATGLPYAATLALTGGLGVATAGLIPVSHAVWLASSALRVAKPEPPKLKSRVRARILGTIGGGVLAAIVLTPPAPVALLALIIAVTVWAMQMIGPTRYGWWTLCLTVVALTFSMQHGTGDWQLAAIRITLTLAGAALAYLIISIAHIHHHPHH